MLREELIEKAGEIIINKYSNYCDVPDKYKFLYVEYKSPKIGSKRKGNNDD